MNRLILAAPLACLVAACVPETTTTTAVPAPAAETPAVPPPDGFELQADGEAARAVRPSRSIADPCGASSVQNLMGMPESVFFSMIFPEDTRFIGPGDAVTQDSRPRRLNFEIGADRRIRRAFCG